MPAGALMQIRLRARLLVLLAVLVLLRVTDVQAAGFDVIVWVVAIAAAFSCAVRISVDGITMWRSVS